MAWRLIVLMGGRETQAVGLDSPPLRIGRHARNGLILDNRTVSAHHAVLHREADGFVLEDLQSTNGTYVNRRSIRRHALQPSDIIDIGPYRLMLVQGDPLPAVRGATGEAPADGESVAPTDFDPLLGTPR